MTAHKTQNDKSIILLFQLYCLPKISYLIIVPIIVVVSNMFNEEVGVFLSDWKL